MHDGRDAQYDLLTAALVGAAIGAGTTLLLRRGPGGNRPMAPAWRIARTGARAGARLARRGARAAYATGAAGWHALPREEMADRMHDYYESARDAIDQAVASELKDLRRAIKRKRKRLGI